MPSMVRGDRTPDILITISDARSEADFSTLQAQDVVVKVEQNGALIVDDQCDSIVVSEDNHSADVRRAWADGETDAIGRCWVSVYVVPWDQTFPDDGPLRFDVGRAAGDA